MTAAASMRAACAGWAWSAWRNVCIIWEERSKCRQSLAPARKSPWSCLLQAETVGTIRILLADDHTVMRSGLRLLLERQPNLRVVAEAADGRIAVDLAAVEN